MKTIEEQSQKGLALMVDNLDEKTLLICMSALKP